MLAPLTDHLVHQVRYFYPPVGVTIACRGYMDYLDMPITAASTGASVQDRRLGDRAVTCLVCLAKDI